jgi:hypothetical protein
VAPEVSRAFILAQVAGIVETWGLIQVHKEGFRARYARPTALALGGQPRESERAAAGGGDRMYRRGRSNVIATDRRFQ